MPVIGYDNDSTCIQLQTIFERTLHASCSLQLYLVLGAPAALLQCSCRI